MEEKYHFSYATNAISGSDPVVKGDGLSNNLLRFPSTMILCLADADQFVCSQFVLMYPSDFTQ